MLVPFLTVFAVDTPGWHYAFGWRTGHQLGFLGLLRIRWCGESINTVVPSARIGGEAVKVYLLHKRGVAGSNSTASVIVGRTLQTIARVVFIALGSVAVMHVAVHKLGVGPAMGVILAASVALLGGMFALQAHGMFAFVLRVVRLLGLNAAALERAREKLFRIDKQVLAFYREDRRHFLLSGGWYMTGWLLDTMDVFLVSHLMGVEISWFQAPGIEAFIGVARLRFFCPR